VQAHLSDVARVALALVMLIGVVNTALYYVRPELFPAFHPWMQVMLDSGYLLVPKAIELMSAWLLLFTRFRVLALSLLWPVIVNIVLFHVLIDHRGWAIVPIVVLLAALASWPERRTWYALATSAAI